MDDTRGKYAPGIRAALELRGWTRHNLAAQMRIRSASVYGWCSGEVKPTVESLFAIGRALGLSTIITADSVEYVEPEAVKLPPEED